MKVFGTLWIAFCFLALPVHAAPPWTLPAEGDCGALRVSGDASPPPAYRPGQVVTFAQLDSLERLLAPELWDRRDLFFFDGMRLELGPCFRRYAPPEFFAESTQVLRTVAAPRERRDRGRQPRPALRPNRPQRRGSRDRSEVGVERLPSVSGRRSIW